MNQFTLPNFVQLQTESFEKFLKYFVLRELKRFPVIVNTEGRLGFIIMPQGYKLSEPFLTEQEAIYQSQNYEMKLYVPGVVTNSKTHKMKVEMVCLGSIPLMTSNGTFIINGISWVILNQIVRKPGVYYTNKNKYIQHATIIFSPRLEVDRDGKGVFVNKSLRIEIDRKGRLWARLTGKRKITLVLLLCSMGMDFDEMPVELLHEKRTYKLEELRYSLTEQIEEFYDEIRDPTKSRGPEELLLYSLNRRLKEIFYLGESGRSNLNRRLHLGVRKKKTFLLAKDVLAITDYLLKVRMGLGYLDDIDHLNNKYVKSVADLLSEQLQLGLLNLARTISRSLDRAVLRKRFPSPRTVVNANVLKSSFNNFFGCHELSQFLDQTNPLADIIHKRKISLLGPGGLTRTTASFRVRDIHPSYYGRICPIETAEGLNAGLICSLATYARVNSEGVIENLLYKNYANDEFLNNTLIVDANRDQELKIAIGNCLSVGYNGQEKQSTPILYKQEFVSKTWDEASMRSIIHIQYLSIGTSLIPFVEHDDANRALMGSTMQRQAVPLIIPEKPIVGTGLEAQIALDSGAVVVAQCDGLILDTDAQHIEQLSLNDKIIRINLINHARSNNGTHIHQRPIVKSGDFIQKGQLLADGSATVQGELSLGKNILVAYMPWEGYNFEDAILINERLVYEDIYTSLHIEKYSVEVYITDLGEENITNKIPRLNQYFLRNLNPNGIIAVGAWVETGDILVGKLTPIEPQDQSVSPEGRLLQAIFDIEETTHRDNSLRVPRGGKGRVIDVRILDDQLNSKASSKMKQIRSVHVYVLQRRRIQVGDKIAGRHGNKGIVSKILPRQDMPYTQDGTPIDMVLSPLGVPSRMNVGQLFECILGLAGSLLNKHYRITPFDEKYEKEASRKLVFSELYSARKSTGCPWVFEPNTPGKTYLFDGRTGEVFNQPITVGKAYMLKLIHQVDDKIHARSTGSYSLVTQQPLRGRSNLGGQRVGEMEVWAIEGFGAANILHEMLTMKSDHIQGRTDLFSAIVSGESIPNPVGPSACLELLVRELRCLGMHMTRNFISPKDLSVESNDI